MMDKFISSIKNKTCREKATYSKNKMQKYIFYLQAGLCTYAYAYDMAGT